MSTHTLPDRRRTETPILTEAGVVMSRSGRDYTVALPASVRDEIYRLSRETPFLETGGGLHTSSEPWAATITLDRAGGPGRHFKRRRSSIEFDPPELDTGGLVGMWHSHPRGRLELSPPDLDCFVRIRSKMSRPIHRFVAILAGPDPTETDPVRGWRKPSLRAWVVGDSWYQQADLSFTPDTPSRATAPARVGSTAAAGRSNGAAGLVATRTFTADYDGERIQVIAGVTGIAAQHELARRYPDAFKAAP